MILVANARLQGNPKFQRPVGFRIRGAEPRGTRQVTSGYQRCQKRMTGGVGSQWNPRTVQASLIPAAAPSWFSVPRGRLHKRPGES